MTDWKDIKILSKFKIDFQIIFNGSQIIKNYDFNQFFMLLMIKSKSSLLKDVSSVAIFLSLD